MLEYSGTLLHGLRQMGAHDVLDSLAGITADPRNRQAVEWLGCPWGHAVAPSTPVQDFRLHVRAWQHHFAALFGLDALGRVRGFSPAEMALPNHPDIAYDFVKTLTDCGYQWVLVQEHTVEEPDGGGLQRQHLPRRLVCTSSSGEVASITAVVKTQGSDTKLVAQMQPYYEAKGLSRWDLGGRRVPPLVTQIADGENGGVMMNEFPPKYFDVIRECSGTQTPAMNVTEYLERLHGPASARRTARVSRSSSPGFGAEWPGDGPDRLADVIEQLKDEDGASAWKAAAGRMTSPGFVATTGAGPMDEASSLFDERVLAKGVHRRSRYRNALFHLLTTETSCYRYWGEGIWTDYGAELAGAPSHRDPRRIIAKEPPMADVALPWSSTCISPPATLRTSSSGASGRRGNPVGHGPYPRSLWADEDVDQVHLSLVGTLLGPWPVPTSSAGSTASSTADRCCGTCRTPR